MRGNCDHVVSAEQRPLRRQSPLRDRQANRDELDNGASTADGMEVPDLESVVGSSAMTVLATDCHLADDLKTSTSHSNDQRPRSFSSVSRYLTQLESDRNFGGPSKPPVGESIFHANKNIEEAIQCTKPTTSTDTTQKYTLSTNHESDSISVAEPTPRISSPTLCTQEGVSKGKVALIKRSSRNGQVPEILGQDDNSNGPFNSSRTRQPLQPYSPAMRNILSSSEEPQVGTEDDYAPCLLSDTLFANYVPSSLDKVLE